VTKKLLKNIIKKKKEDNFNELPCFIFNFCLLSRRLKKKEDK